MENNMNITTAQYVADPISGTNDTVQATIDGQLLSVPLDPANGHYAEILKQVAADTLRIADAE